MKIRISVSDNFFLDEFLDPYTYLFEKDHGLNKLDFRLFQIAQKLRELYGKSLYINTWWKTYEALTKKGVSDMEIIEAIEKDSSIRKWSGLRTNRSNVGSKNGAHYKGKGIDLKGNASELHGIVKNNARELYSLGLRRIEDKKIAKKWLHADTYELNTKPNSIRVVDLKKSTETIYF